MDNTCECEICKNRLPFEMPMEIVDAVTKGQLVLFAGAGISTENNRIFKETLYQDIANELKIDLNSGVPFPKLMSKYCASNKNGRQKLLEKIKYRFDYCHQFNELYRSASTFHRALAPFWMIKNIITTNWDDYFERECNAIPIVTAEDFAFFNIDQRKVFKIHGSISNYGSVIATEEDYKNCYKNLNSGLVGANLKTLLATKTILFVGYSFNDFDFLKVLDYLKKEMGNILPHLYILTLDDLMNDRLSKFKTTIIKVDGLYFLETLRKHFEKNDYILPEENIDRLYLIEHLNHTTHQLVSDHYEKKKCPSLIYCLFYQDGIQHAIDYLQYKAKTGETYSPYRLIKQLDIYELRIKKDLVKIRNYADLAYVEGYIQGLRVPIMFDNPKNFPLFFLFGKGPTNDVKFFTKSINKGLVYHKSAEIYGQRFFKEFLKSDMIMHHKPFIF